MGLFIQTLSFAGKVAWEGSKLAVEYTPKVLVTLAQTKRELVEFIDDEIDEYKKWHEEELQNNRIKALKMKKEIDEDLKESIDILYKQIKSYEK